MIKINRKMEYALMALSGLQGTNVQNIKTARELCSLYHIPFDTLSKVLQILKLHHIVDSTKGVKGGYYLTTDLADVTYLQLSKILDESINIVECHQDSCSLSSQCNIKKPMQNLNSLLDSFFSKLNLHQLFNEQKIREI